MMRRPIHTQLLTDDRSKPLGFLKFKELPFIRCVRQWEIFLGYDHFMVFFSRCGSETPPKQERQTHRELAERSVVRVG